MPRKVRVGDRVIAFPDGMSDEAISAELVKNFPSDPVAPSPADPGSAPGEIPSGAGSEEPAYHGLPFAKAAGRFTRANLPAIAGAAGGIAAGGAALPAIALAALMGAGGRGAQIAMDATEGKVSPSMGHDLADMGTSGAIQGAVEGGGRAIMAPVKWAAHGLYRGLLKPPTALRNEFGGGGKLTRTLLREGAPISERGVAQMDRRLATNVAEARRMEAAAEAAGAPAIRGQEVAGRTFDRVRDDAAKRVAIGLPDEAGAVAAREAKLVEGMANRPVVSPAVPAVPASTILGPNGLPMRPAQAARPAVLGPDRGTPLTKASALKSFAGDLSDQAMRARDRGVKELGIGDQLNEATARGLKESVESRVPGIRRKNTESQELMGALLALRNAVETGANNNFVVGAKDMIAGGAGVGAAVHGATGGQAAALFAALRALASRGTGSRAAILMDRTGRLPLPQTAARGLSTLVPSHDQ